jgi:hypothetical protein
MRRPIPWAIFQSSQPRFSVLFPAQTQIGGVPPSCASCPCLRFTVTRAVAVARERGQEAPDTLAHASAWCVNWHANGVCTPCIGGAQRTPSAIAPCKRCDGTTTHVCIPACPPSDCVESWQWRRLWRLPRCRAIPTLAELIGTQPARSESGITVSVVVRTHY